MNVAIACGGTGGHLFPGVAVAETLRLRGHRVLLLVSEKEIDRHAFQLAATVEVRAIPGIGLPPWTSPRIVTFLAEQLRATRLCGQLFDDFKPDVVLGMGGFTSAPPVFAARRRRVPIVLHDSNAIPGRATRLLARFAAAVAVGMDECTARLPGRRVVNTGTPVRASLRKRPAGDARWQLGLETRRQTVLVVGGSQGARGLNDLVLAALPHLKHLVRQLQFIHLTGESDFERLRAAWETTDFKAVVRPFQKEMELAYSAATLAVSRSGAAGLAELAWFGLPAILVPFPAAADNHQFFNAQFAAHNSGARVMTQAETSGEMLARAIEEMLVTGTRRDMAEKMAALRRPDAAAAIATLLAEVAGVVEPSIARREIETAEIIRLLGESTC
ncbi:MAG: undecaprenyldiphospho-muramoylpentapeptide beta-N-acetylglucosaminyltransferase, partial [Verrucomicrobia bacterium]|nr:undecaprenyldiphospho-muramoylpentapeptide beta-N-acetylglucosaminyltransferase [Verrucomicrobiota bacterium]